MLVFTLAPEVPFTDNWLLAMLSPVSKLLAGIRVQFGAGPVAPVGPCTSSYNTYLQCGTSLTESKTCSKCNIICISICALSRTGYSIICYRTKA